jgi:sugar transferase (PEP-CTERM/EpsH1 system associated)
VPTSKKSPVHIAHVIHRLATGGMENGVVNLINRTDPARVTHSIVCMTDSTDFRERITREGVGIFEMHKNPQGRDLAAQRRAYSHFRSHRPDIVHTRNLTGLDAVVPAFFARVPVRLHGEHGRDMTDPDGTNKKFIFLKKLHAPFIHRWTAVSQDLAQSLRERVGIPAAQISHICNGVDLSRFSVAPTRRNMEGFSDDTNVVFGTVGRLQDVKEQWLLIEALAFLPQLTPNADHARVMIVGGGPMQSRLEEAIAKHNLTGKVLLPGNQTNVPEWMAAMDVFCLPSRAEGISNTILEAMACGLPVLATRVGGNPELVVEGETGMLVPYSDAKALAEKMARYVDDPGLRRKQGAASRERALSEFSMETMVARYTDLYCGLAAARG